jgi:recombination protein RecA
VASKKPKRSPVRKPKPKRKSVAKSTSKRPTVRKDPLKEFRETIQKDGVVEVLTMADDDCLANVKTHVSTQSLALDRLLNGQGFPCGRVVELIGPPHIGKSTVIDHAFAQVQKMGGIAVLADTEGARDSTYTRNIGVDLTTLQYLDFPRKPVMKDKKIVGYEEQLHLENVLTKILESADFWATKYPDLPVVIGLDALAGTATKDEMANRLSKDEKPAQAAKLLRKICRQFPTYIGNTKVAILIANHEYQQINMGSRAASRRESYGGDAIRHLASIRLSLFYGGEWVKRGEGEILGRVVKATLIKNRLGNPWGEARIAILSGVGINNTWSIVDKLRQAKLMVTSGSWSTINLDGEDVKFQGWTGLQQKCREDPTLFPRLVSVYKGIP